MKRKIVPSTKFKKDWVLIYGKTDTNELRILELVRLNSHSNLFK